MRKLFLFIATALVSSSIWADISYYTPTADEVITLVDQTAATISTHAAIGNAAKTFTIQGSAKTCGDPEDASTTRSFAKSLTLKTGNSAKTLVLNIAGCDSITLYHDKNNKARGIEGTATTSSNAVTNLVGPTSTFYTGFALDPNNSYTLVFTAYEGTPGTGGDINVAAVQLHKGETCADPESTIKADTTLYAGASYNIGFNSINTNSCTVDVKKNGATAVDDVDYTRTSIVNYTFLKAGEFVITISQAADGTHCAVEESVTVTVNEATPVESVTIGDAAHSARIGGSIELSATAANATEYQWFLNDEAIKGAETDSYTFNATAAGSYSFVCKARNDFNSGTWIASSAHVITVTVGTDATLSDLKVNGTTVAGFDAATLEYNLGEIGVYEALAVTATAADAPYATTAVVDNKTNKVTITVTAEDNTIKTDYVINYTRKAATELVTISESTTWDWANAGTTSNTAFDANSMPTNAEEFNFADVMSGYDPALFKASSLAGIQQYYNRSDHYAQGYQLRFITTVPGTVAVRYSNTGNKRPYRHIEVNGILSENGEANGTATNTEAFTVSAGEVTIKVYIPDADTPQARDGDVVGYSMARFYKVTFTKSEATSIDNTADGVKAVKRIENGQLIIEKNGVRYNAMGQAIR